ncbi:nuclear transport factor 2 family protein [Vibrio vulnificus]
MNANTIANKYLDALEKADIEKVLSLFTPDATVSSPLYGECKATDFYPELFGDTRSSKITLNGVMEGKSTRECTDLISIWFDFDWTLANGEPAPFNVVDVLEVDKDSRLITKLNIVYDTFNIRRSFNLSKKQFSL